MTKLDKEFMKRVRKLIEKRRLDRRKMFRKLAQGVGFSFKSPVPRGSLLPPCAVGIGVRTKSIGRKRGVQEKGFSTIPVCSTLPLKLGRA